MQIPVRGAKQWPAFGDTGNKWLRERENGNKLRRNCESEADERNFVVNSARLESDDERACWIIVQGGRSNRYFGSWPFTLSLSLALYPHIHLCTPLGAVTHVQRERERISLARVCCCLSFASRSLLLFSVVGRPPPKLYCHARRRRLPHRLRIKTKRIGYKLCLRLHFRWSETRIFPTDAILKWYTVWAIWLYS